jgi:hypothetical protein
MRFALAFLLMAAAVAPAVAQGTPKETPSKSEEVLRQRILLRERFNKGWDVQIENSRDRIEGRCNADARKRYSAIHPLKRRKFAKDCIAKATR